MSQPYFLRRVRKAYVCVQIRAVFKYIKKSYGIFLDRTKPDWNVGSDTHCWYSGMSNIHFSVLCHIKGHSTKIKASLLVMDNTNQPVKTFVSYLLWLWRSFVKSEKITTDKQPHLNNVSVYLARKG